MWSMLLWMACATPDGVDVVVPVADRAARPAVGGPGTDQDLAAEREGSVVGGHVEAWMARDSGGHTRIVVAIDGGPPLDRVTVGNPDRPALSPDGKWLAWVSGATGIASVFVTEVAVDGPVVQVTNVGVEQIERVPGVAPSGFVPPPIDDSLAFDGDWLTWEGPGGRVRERWR